MLKKKHYLIVGIVATVIILLYTASMLFTVEQKKVTDQFFEYIRGSRYTYAYEMTYPKFQENTSLDQFVDYANELQLKEQTAYKSWWRMPGSLKTTLHGRLIYENYNLPATFVLVKQADEWKIATFKIEAQRMHLKVEEPSNEQIAVLLQDSLSNLVYGVQSGDYTKLHNMLGDKVKEVLSKEDLANEMLKLREVLSDNTIQTGDEMNVDLSKNFDQTGILSLAGTYEDLFQFEFSYVYENEEWKLVAMTANELF